MFAYTDYTLQADNSKREVESKSFANYYDNVLNNLPLLECNNSEQLHFFNDAIKSYHVRLRVPFDFAIKNLKSFDVVDGLYSPEFEWGKFQGKTRLIPLLARYSNLTLISYEKTDYLICMLLDINLRRTLHSSWLQDEYIYYYAGMCSFTADYDLISSDNSWFYYLFRSNYVNINHIVSKYDFPIWEMKADMDYKCGTRLTAPLKDALARYDNFILENYTGYITKEGINYVAVKNNLIYAKKDNIIFLDNDETNMNSLVVFRPLIELKNITLGSYLWKIKF